MPDGLDFSYSDPRFLRQKIKALEKDVETLKKSVMPFAIHQRGATAGALRAIAINDQGLASSMWMNFSNIGPGSGPYWAVTDANKVIRVEGGNLAANGNSPAQEGLRVNDGSGNPIFDSLGLIAVMSVLGSFTDSNGDTITSTTPVVLDSVSVTFSLARQSNVLAWFMSTGQVTTTGGRAGASARMFFDTVAHGPTGRWDTANPGVTHASICHFISLAAGSHTIDYRVNVDNNTCTWTNFQTTLDVFLLGT